LAIFSFDLKLKG